MRLQTVFVLILPFILVLWATPARCSADFDFSAYPASTRTCLEDAADDSTCTADSADEDTNMCLCSNTGNFVLSAAACIGDQGADVLAQVYELMQDDCSDAKTPLTVSEAEWFMAANGTTVTVTSTITTTSAGILTTYTTTSTSSHIASEATATSSSTSSAGGSSSSQGPGQGMTASAEIGAITSSVAGALAIACMVCMFFMFKKRRTDKREMRAALEAGRRIGGGGDRRSNDKPLLSLGAMTPGSRSPLGASVTPPPPSEPGASASSQVWRSSLSQTSRLGTPVSPTELPSHQPPCELPDSGVGGGHGTQWPSPISQGVGTMGSWCPSPVSALVHTNTMGTYDSTTNTLGPISTLSPTLSRPLTRSGTVRSSWAHERPALEGPYELPGNEIEYSGRADTIPLSTISERQSTTTIRQAPPEYSSAGWVDPNGDKTWI